jgi:Peptidase family M1 domain
MRCLIQRLRQVRVPHASCQSLFTLHLAVLRMLSNYVSEEKFLKGVSIYLKKHLYANSVSKDLWDGISEATGEEQDLLVDYIVLTPAPIQESMFRR